MQESEIIEPVDAVVDYATDYSMPELYLATSNAVLYRVRKAGKYFIIKTPKDNSGQGLAMLQREYELSLGKTHPNIVTVFTFEQNTIVGPGIVMEYVDGRTLAAFLAENPATAMRERVFEQLLQAVAYIHRCGVVHNDIKPENILVTRADNDVRLIDFGLADADAYCMARMLGCTPAYASPELLAREKDIDARSDIYSLGVVMREIFGNRLSRIAGHCLCACKEKRYANAEQLLAAFRHRNRPLRVLATTFVALLLLLLLLYTCRTGMGNAQEITRQKAAAEQMTLLRDSLLAKVEVDVAAVYECVADSVSRAPYSEFAGNNILSFYEILAEYYKSNISPIADPDISSAVTNRYMLLLNSAQEQLWEKAKQLPSYYKSGLPIPAVIYYDSLVTHRLPYVPYINK
jgi:serine/threonine protein kinase